MQITEKQRNSILKWLYISGYILLTVGTIIYFSDYKTVAPYLYSLGVVFLVVVRVILPIDTADQRTKRLNKIHAFASLVLVASAYGMFIHYYLWLPGLLLSTLLDLLVSFRLPKKEE
jgi:hypothetical protein